MMVVEGNTDPALEQKIVGWMMEMTLDELLARPEIQAVRGPLWEQHERTVELIRTHAWLDSDIVRFDLSDTPLDGYNKFIPYYLYPTAVYTVGLIAGPRRTKLSVGSNPWRRDERRHDIAALCEQHGGGGHPAVGAVSLPPGQIEAARQIADVIANALRA
jgi:hypothetical protein